MYFKTWIFSKKPVTTSNFKPPFLSALHINTSVTSLTKCRASKYLWRSGRIIKQQAGTWKFETLLFVAMVTPNTTRGVCVVSADDRAARAAPLVLTSAVSALCEFQNVHVTWFSSTCNLPHLYLRLCSFPLIIVIISLFLFLFLFFSTK
jgi:hypothetical protein